MQKATENSHSDDWDLFFSHASEDKPFVLPLAQLLIDCGVSVWLDAHELKAGDSLSKSIDTGLIHSKYAVVVLSPAFLSKRWPEYEYRGLLAKELAAEGKIILPLWHNVTHSDILKYSPTLADKFAIPSANQTLQTLASKIIAIVRPELHDALNRRAQDVMSNDLSTLPLTMHDLPGKVRTQLENTEIKAVSKGPIQHHHLTEGIIQRIRFIRAALLDVYPQTMEFWVDGFRRDRNMEREVEIWERAASVYLELKTLPEFATQENKATAFSLLMVLMWNAPIFETDDIPARTVDLVRARWEASPYEDANLIRETDQQLEIRTYHNLDKKLDSTLARLEWDIKDEKQRRHLQYLRVQAKNVTHNILSFSELIENEILQYSPELHNTKNVGLLRFYVIISTAGIVLEALKWSTEGKIQETLRFMVSNEFRELGGDYENGLLVLNKFVDYGQTQCKSSGLQDWAEFAGMWLLINLTEEKDSDAIGAASPTVSELLLRRFEAYWLPKTGV